MLRTEEGVYVLGAVGVAGKKVGVEGFQVRVFGQGRTEFCVDDLGDLQGQRGRESAEGLAEADELEVSGGVRGGDRVGG